MPALLPLRPLLALLLLLAVTLVAVPAPARADHEGEGVEHRDDGFPAESEDEEEELEWADDEDYVEVPAETPPAPAPTPAPPADVFSPGEEDPAVPAAPAEPQLPPLVTSRTVKGKLARLRTDGKAAIPRSAPKQVKAIIAAANQIVGKPYKWGGGHARLIDKGYDCSGSVSYALIRAGLLLSPAVSGSLAKYGKKNAGRHVAIYANKGHVYMEVAGLRLDTSPVADPNGGKGPRWRPVIGRRAGFHARHPAGL